ncbi:MAG: hypothetical protein H6816_14305 [Phycisphaerales bacterium]|nr:hypothetical protein [Phycisphaerales bacterium]
MKSALGKILRHEFRRRFRERYPGFQELRDVVLPPGWVALGLDITPSFSVYVVLVVYRNEDRFTIELAWTRNGRFPTHVPLLYPRDLPEFNVKKDRDRDGDFCCRIGKFWQIKDFSWRVREPQFSKKAGPGSGGAEYDDGALGESRDNRAPNSVQALIDDALSRIDVHVMPYFDEVASELGHAESVAKLAKSR